MQELSAQQYVQDHRPRSWSRSTVADGRWMQDKTFTPLNGNDEQLGIFIDDLVKGLNTEETTRANADEAEAAARQQNDSDLSAWCTRLTNSAEDLYSDLADEVAARQAAIEAEERARTQGDADTLASAKEYANDASAYALAEAKTYANDTSSYLNGRINGVSSTFNSFSSDLKTWKEGVENWEGGIDTWKNGINTWRNDTVDPKLNELESAIAGIEGASDVYDVVATSAALNNYTGRLTPKAVIKVLSAGPNNDQQVYYRWNHNTTASGTWTIADFDYIGGVQAYYDKGYIDSNYYKKTETYTKTEVDNYLQWKVDASTSQNFNTDQKWQARQNIGASDGKIPFTQYDSGWKTTSADLSITYSKQGDNYYRLHIDDGTTTADWALVPEPDNAQNNYLLTITSNGIEWLAPSAELPPVTRPADVGKALVVGSDGLSWDDRGNGYYFVNLKSTNANTFKEVKAAASAHKTIIGYEEEYESHGTKAYKYFTFAGEYWDQYAFFDSNTNEIQEKRRLWSAGNVSAYNQRFLYTSEQVLQTGEKEQVRENIDAAAKPLIIHVSPGTMDSADFTKLRNAITNGEVVYLRTGSSSQRLYTFVEENGGAYEFSSWLNDMYDTIQINRSSHQVTMKSRVRIQDNLPIAFEQGCIYIV